MLFLTWLSFLYLQSRDVNGLNVSTELFTDDIVSQQLSLDSLSVGLRLITLIHSHDQWN